MKLRGLKQAQIRPGTIVLVRVDWNVPIGPDGQVDRIEDYKIQRCTPTLEWLLKRKARLILATHLGRPQGKPDKRFVLHPVKRRGQYLLGRPIHYIHDVRKDAVMKALDHTYPFGIVLVENLRFYPGEEKNDRAFARELASCAQVYVNNAFGVSHRAHASVEAITHVLPSYAGRLLEEEVHHLDQALHHVRHPYVVLMGGAKIRGKIDLVKQLSSRADTMALGGGIATTVLGCNGKEVGRSLSEHREADMCVLVKSQQRKKHFLLPTDVVVANDLKSKKTQIRSIDHIQSNDIIGDLGPSSTRTIIEEIKKAKMIVWNGPMGYTENPAFDVASRKIAQGVARSKAYSLAGGGESVSLLVRYGVVNKLSFVSTGGGAMLEYLEGRKLPGVEALRTR
ncbi:phosphoglycerate kinase [Candidatus Uhrbacteria bacterium]|nr:phosphoglycerate kinase [Candidatus Uhrbacteria bacterium]